MHREIPLPHLQALPAGLTALDDAEVAARLERFGPNHILETPPNPWRRLLVDTLRDPMLWFLFGTGMIYVLLGDTAEASLLFAAILPLAGMDAWLHRRTQASTEGLGRQLAHQARVVREGLSRVVPAASLVPGDLVEVAAGEAMPADGVILEGHGLQAEESSLTGESLPVAKQSLNRSLSVVPGEQATSVEDIHWGFAGTRLLTGQARLRVVFTGAHTLYGEIVRASRRGRSERTPLQGAIATLVSALTGIALLLCLILGAVRLLQGQGWLDALVSAVTLAVAALPEEFPVVLTFFLGLGVFRLARRKALVRQSVSVENIGRVSCLCVDKTGTLTEGRLLLTHLLPAPGFDEETLLRLGALASRPEAGDPLDQAIRQRQAGQQASGEATSVLATYPYTEQRRRETAVLSRPDDLLAASKGAPELLLALTGLTPAERATWRAQAERLAAEGHKVLACVQWILPHEWRGGEPDRLGTLAGLLAFADPVRPGAREAVDECLHANIRVIMVTGDHPGTAAKVAREVGLDGSRLLLGDDLEARLREAGPEALDHIQVVARALPTQKQALVLALKARGETVAVTGDGVNDVPALQSADVGIAMGERGTRSAREAAAIVLLNDDFGTLVRAVAEGRQLFLNLQLSFQYLLIIHIPLVTTAILVPLAGHPLLYLPIHIVWLEALIHPTALLVFQELPARGQLAALPKRRAVRFFSRREWLVVGMSGGLITALVLWGWYRGLGPGYEVEHARSLAMATMSSASAAATALLSGLRTVAARVMTVVPLLLAPILIQIPALAERLALQPLHPGDWLLAGVGGLTALALPRLVYSLAPSSRG